MTEDTEIKGIRPERGPDEPDDHVEVAPSPDEPAVAQPDEGGDDDEDAANEGGES